MHPIRVGRAAVALLIAVAAVGCTRSPEFAPSGSIVRLASGAGYARYGGVSRVVLAQQDISRIEVPPRGASRLDVAVALSAAEAKPVHCRVNFAEETSASPIAGDVVVGGARTWTELRLELPATRAAGTLSLECDDPGAVVWAQPLLVPSATRTAEPLIVMLSLDTLRADHVTGFGDPQVPTPTLAAVAREGVSFTAAASPYTWTLPSHFSLFYSRLYGFPSSAQPSPGMARLLAERGFATAGFTGGGFVSAEFRFDVGFDRYAEYDASRGGRSDIDAFPDLLTDASHWIDAHEAVPSFLFLHTYAVHELPAAERAKQQARGALAPYDITPEEVAEAREFYGRLVGRVDAALAPFVEKLRVIAGRRPTMLVVLSDHGEAFHEHGNLRHGTSGPQVTLHDEVIHIPMIFWAPGIVTAGAVSSHPFSLLDVAPTLLAAAGRSVPPSMVGRDFWPLLRGAQTTDAERERWDAPVVSYKNPGWGAPAAWSTRTASRKQIVHRRATPGAATVETYDLAKDALERDNLTGTDEPANTAAAIAHIRDHLERLETPIDKSERSLPVCPHCGISQAESFWKVFDPQSEDHRREGDIDPDTQQRLKALGYLN